jgi:hypothetical protein
MFLKLKKKIENSKINLKPFPHIIIKNLLEENKLKELNKSLPSYDDLGRQDIIFQSSSETKKNNYARLKNFQITYKKKSF